MNTSLFVTLVELQARAATPPQEGLHPVDLVLQASPTVKAVMLLLVAMSLASWFIIGAKVVQLLRATQESTRFLDLFWRAEPGATWTAERLEAVYGQLKALPHAPLAHVFHAGYVELARITSAEPRAGRPNAAGDIDNIERALRRASVNELTTLETLVPFLATTGSTAPFVGLFGTVWGIMNSFIAIGGQKNASLDVVAPGIAEALIATAIGLVAAIPAVMAYNYFVRRIHVLENEMESFASDFLNIVRRHFLVG